MNRLRLWLTISLLVNLFLVAAITAGIVTWHVDRKMVQAGSLRVAGSELPQAERRAFRQALRQARRAMRPTMIASRQDKAEAARLLRAPVLDPAAVNEMLDRARVADMAVRAAVERRAVRFASGLPRDERVALANTMEKRFREEVKHQRKRRNHRAGDHS